MNVADMQEEALRAIAEAADTAALDTVRVRYLGRKGLLSEQLRLLGSLSAAERPAAGQALNRIRASIEEALGRRETELGEEEERQRLLAERLDVTLPGRERLRGHVHPLMQAWQEVEQVFRELGFAVAEGPEVENDFYNFEALNMPQDHPARDMQDSFFLPGGLLLRTHTSPVQIRTMEAARGVYPLRIIAPGRVYRRDDDATHSPVFHQVEALAIDEGLGMADLKGTLQAFAEGIFGSGVRIRLRPSYFPFTEPSAEVDVSCIFCGGHGCRTCKGTGWLEILGSGMVHPFVLRAGGYDPERVNGFALGLGIERVAMLKYGFSDLRLFYQNDLRMYGNP